MHRSFDTMILLILKETVGFQTQSQASGFQTEGQISENHKNDQVSEFINESGTIEDVDDELMEENENAENNLMEIQEMNNVPMVFNVTLTKCNVNKSSHGVVWFHISIFL